VLIQNIVNIFVCRQAGFPPRVLPAAGRAFMKPLQL
jgi:hypothetical protein